MTITEIRVDNEITHIGLVGKLDIVGLHSLDLKFHGYTAARRKPTLVDLSQLEFIASLGMGMLVACAKSLQRHGTKMVLLSPTAFVEEALRAVGIDQVIPIAHSLEEGKRLLFPSSTPGGASG